MSQEIGTTTTTHYFRLGSDFFGEKLRFLDHP